jgi:hypothetical protein
MAEEMSMNGKTGNEAEDNAIPATASTASSRFNGRLILLAIVAIGVLPLLAALYFRYVSPPEVKATVGQALDPVPLPFEFLRLDAAQRVVERCRHTLISPVRRVPHRVAISPASTVCG